MKAELSLRVDKIETGVISYIKKHPRLYIVSKCLQNISKQDLYELISGYYEQKPGLSTMVLRQGGELYPDEIVYGIDYGVKVKDERGFYALVRNMLTMLNVAIHMGFTPAVRWGEKTFYYDQGMDETTHNVFEYYFEPVSKISGDDLPKCRNLVHAINSNTRFFMEHPSSYVIDEAEIRWLANLYKRFIRLNSSTQKYVEQALEKTITGKRTLGIHVRGTDFNQGFNKHPTALRSDKVIESARRILSQGNYEQVFLATEDQRIMDSFIAEFGDSLVYYGDVARSNCDISPVWIEVVRPLHHYKLGLEVIRDAYTLANCDGLISGLSQVAFAARYINRSLDRSYNDLVVLDNGINENGRRHMVNH